MVNGSGIANSLKLLHWSAAITRVCGLPATVESQIMPSPFLLTEVEEDRS